MARNAGRMELIKFAASGERAQNPQGRKGPFEGPAAMEATDSNLRDGTTQAQYHQYSTFAQYRVTR